ncbi:hypothetical protein QJS04_geneDACA014680 [Acorus gramineus]|uniref:Uncharacterized protein n=1 Tax=Acorus gramineus TaxID=55184 RepID=A0AAV9B263_ACOGR|nr:hypothetical protein QJS04_geneDACA014680 [Acorus gramineus]
MVVEDTMVVAQRAGKNNERGGEENERERLTPSSGNPFTGIILVPRASASQHHPHSDITFTTEHSNTGPPMDP